MALAEISFTVSLLQCIMREFFLTLNDGLKSEGVELHVNKIERGGLRGIVFLRGVVFVGSLRRPKTCS